MNIATIILGLGVNIKESTFPGEVNHLSKEKQTDILLENFTVEQRLIHAPTQVVYHGNNCFTTFHRILSLMCGVLAISS